MTDLSCSEILWAAAAKLRDGSPLVSPTVVEPLAKWLEDNADDMDQEDRAEPETSQESYSVAFARSILR
jgi:hypothetical protein